MPDAVTHELDNETVSDYILREAGSEVLEYVAYPLTSVLYISEPEETSKVALLATLLYLQGLELFNSASGIGVLAKAMAGSLDVRLGFGVDTLRVAERTVAGGGSVEALLADGSKLEAAAAICTLPAALVGGLMPQLPEAAHAALSQVPYAATTPVALALARPTNR